MPRQQAKVQAIRQQDRQLERQLVRMVRALSMGLSQKEAGLRVAKLLNEDSGESTMIQQMPGFLRSKFLGEPYRVYRRTERTRAAGTSQPAKVIQWPTEASR
jgi:hypothetical protein